VSLSRKLGAFAKEEMFSPFPFDRFYLPLFSPVSRDSASPFFFLTEEEHPLAASSFSGSFPDCFPPPPTFNERENEVLSD